MKWALIYLLGTSGIWDSGYRFADYKTCDDFRYQMAASIYNNYRNSSTGSIAEEYDILQASKCLPSKE
jgi:hypothetical protein